MDVSRVEQAAVLVAKAERALSSAHLLLLDGDPDGACNRAYYAMFDAARAALAALAPGSNDGMHKTHRGLIAAFSDAFVRPGMISRDLGRLLKRAEEMRLVADYRGDEVSLQVASEMVETAEAFIGAVKTMMQN